MKGTRLFELSENMREKAISLLSEKALYTMQNNDDYKNDIDFALLLVAGNDLLLTKEERCMCFRAMTDALLWNHEIRETEKMLRQQRREEERKLLRRR